jgi:glycosyltransferase involved in cell wall biosynthesis
MAAMPVTQAKQQSAHVLYVGAILPKRSETFVYREVFGLRDRGWRVTAASIHPPDRALGDRRLDQLADEAVVVYRPRLLLDAVIGAALRPGVALRGVADAIADPDVPLSRRPRVLVQLAGGLSLAWRLRREGVTHVHAHMAHVPATVAMYAAAALGVPMTFTGHAADLFRDRQMLRRKLERAAQVMCISEWHRDFYKTWVERDDEDFPVVRCGVDLEKFTPGEGGNGILAVGRLVPKKGFDTMIRAFAQVVAESEGQEGFRLTLIGDGPERQPLEELASELGVGSLVDFHGAGTEREVRAAMKRADLFVLPCRVSADGDRDGIPVVLMEAMASGVPVVCGDLPTIRELVVDDSCGRLLPPDDVDAFAEQIRRLLCDEAERRAVGLAGRVRVAEEFSARIALDRLERCYAHS